MCREPGIQPSARSRTWSGPVLPPTQKRRFRMEAASFCNVTCKEEFLVLGRPGSDLLSQGLSHSTIGAEEFNGRVRDGIGFRLLARTTRPAQDKENEASCPSAIALRSHLVVGLQGRMDTENESNQANRTISTGKLHA